MFLQKFKMFTKINSRVFCLRNYFVNFLRKKNYKLDTRPQILHRPNKVNTILAGFWFLWPTNSNPDTVNSNNTTVKEIDLIPSVLELSDRLFESGRYEECYNVLVNYKIQDDAEIKWRICRALYNMAKDSKFDNKNKCNFISEAYEIISEELENKFDNYAVQKWYALILDARSTNEGMQEKIEQLENVKKHMDIAVTLNPNDASLLHMLGEWCFQISEIPWHQRKTAEAIFATIPQSTYEDALEYYLRAESVQPRFYSINLLRIGCCYLKLKKEDQAKYYLKLAASYPAKSDDDHYAKKEAAELLKKLKKYT